jgi:hypothetical protein
MDLIFDRQDLGQVPSQLSSVGLYATEQPRGRSMNLAAVVSVESDATDRVGCGGCGQDCVSRSGIVSKCPVLGGNELCQLVVLPSNRRPRDC